MKSSKLIRYLSALDSEEMRSLRKFLVSPYFNTNAKLVKLYDWLHPHHPEFKSSKLTKEKAFALLYPEQTFKMSKVNDNLSKLGGLVEKFIAQTHFETSEFHQNKFLAAGLELKQLNKDFEKLINKIIAEQKLSKRQASNWEKHVEHISILLQYYHTPAISRSVVDLKLLEQVDKHTNELYRLLRLQTGYEQLSGKRIQGELEELSIPLDIKRILEEESENTQVQIYTYLFNLYSSDSPLEIFIPMVDLYKVEYENIDSPHQKVVFFQILNQAISLNRLGLIAYEYIIDLYKLGLNEQFLFVNNQLPAITYANIAVSTAGYDKDFTSLFLEEYYGFVPEVEREMSYSYGRGYLLFYQQQYYKAIAVLSDIQFPPDSLYNLNRKGVILRSWFELFLLDRSNEKILISQIMKYDRFLLRKKKMMSSVKFQSYKNFLAILKNILMVLKSDKLQSESLKLKETIEQTSPLVLRKWLLEKVNSID